MQQFNIGRLWSLLLWRYSRSTWTRSCATCCRQPCFGRGVGLDAPQRSLPTPTILWFCDSASTPPLQTPPSQRGWLSGFGITVFNSTLLYTVWTSLWSFRLTWRCPEEVPWGLLVFSLTQPQKLLLGMNWLCQVKNIKVKPAVLRSFLNQAFTIHDQTLVDGTRPISHMRSQCSGPSFAVNIPPCLLCDFGLAEENLVTRKGIYTTFQLGLMANVMLKPIVLPKSSPRTIFLLLQDLLEEKQTWPYASRPSGFLMGQRSSPLPVSQGWRPSATRTSSWPWGWPEQPGGPSTKQPVPHKGAASLGQHWTKPLPLAATPPFPAGAFQSCMVLAQVIKGQGSDPLPASAWAS